MKRGSRGARIKYPEPIQTIRDPYGALIYAGILEELKVPIKHWPVIFVLVDFGNGRSEFEASNEDLALHTTKVFREGRLQSFLRQAVEDGYASSAEVEKLIAEESGYFGSTPDQPQPLTPEEFSNTDLRLLVKIVSGLEEIRAKYGREVAIEFAHDLERDLTRFVREWIEKNQQN